MNVAFKCTYNDADEGVHVGFNGACSVDNVIRNIKGGRVWCSSQECPCRQYYDAGFRGDAPTFPCYESELFREWRFGGGVYQHGKRAGRPISINQAEVGDVVVLTTRFPDGGERSRKIIGLFKVAQIEQHKQTFLYATDDCRLRLPMEEARHLDFWDYYAVKAREPVWGTRLFRYLTDKAVAKILADLKDTVRNETDRMVVMQLLEERYGCIDRSEYPKGMLRHRVSRADAIAMMRKYGPGGEGEEHRKLKEWIADHPEAIGIGGVREATPEHRFCSGDAVDILFEMNDGSDVVVEIETIDPLPGCHQAIKYRALRCAQRGYRLDSKKVSACVVAWEIPGEVAAFCERYGLKATCARAGG